MGAPPLSAEPGPPSPAQGRLRRGYATAMGLVILAFYFVPDDSWVHVGIQVAVGYVAAAFVVVGMRRNRPPGAIAWYLFGSGVFLNASGTLVEGIISRVYHINDYPTLADAFWLGLYPGFIAGMVVIIRRRGSGRDWATLLETGTITTGLALLSWTLIISRQAFDPTMSSVGRATVVCYPLCDLILLGMMVRTLLGGGAKSPPLRMVFGSLLSFLISDAGWALLSHLGSSPSPAIQRILAMFFMSAYALVGAAALHPAVPDVGVAAAPRDDRLSPGLLVGLAIASLVAPALLVAQALRREITDALAIALGSTVMFSLVLARMAQLLRRVENQARLLRDLSRADELTGLPNRRAWSDELPAAIERARRDKTPVTVAMIDLDHFKRFNDTHGHPAGDRLLVRSALVWRNHLRVFDQLARYGGEEFIALLPRTDAAQASQIVERLRAATPGNQTFSAGIATWNGLESAEELIDRADRALYQAKDWGRNRTVVAAAACPVQAALAVGTE
jgi:diguanylate cyclase (GGDEF)-like protein